MNCDEVKALLPEVLSAGGSAADASAVERGAVEAHLASCAACAREALEIRRVLEAVRDAADVAPREAAPVPPFGDVLRAARARRRRRAWPWLAQAAALLLAALVGVAVDRAIAGRRGEPTPAPAPGSAPAPAVATSPPAPPPVPGVAAVADPAAARQALAARPGGLGASLGVLAALDRAGGRR